MATIRFRLLLGTALIAAAGCAQLPVTADQTSAAPMSAATPGSSATTVAQTARWVSDFPPQLLVFAYEQGWRQVVVSGKDRYFCRSDLPSGSLIASHRCVTESELEFIRLTVQQQQQQMTRPIPNDRAG